MDIFFTVKGGDGARNDGIHVEGRIFLSDKFEIFVDIGHGPTGVVDRAGVYNDVIRIGRLLGKELGHGVGGLEALTGHTGGTTNGACDGEAVNRGNGRVA